MQRDQRNDDSMYRLGEIQNYNFFLNLFTVGTGDCSLGFVTWSILDGFVSYDFLFSWIFLSVFFFLPIYLNDFLFLFVIFVLSWC